MAISTPCISVCCMSAVHGYCEGCFRSLQEVSSWVQLPESERQRIMREVLPERKKQFA